MTVENRHRLLNLPTYNIKMSQQSKKFRFSSTFYRKVKKLRNSSIAVSSNQSTSAYQENKTEFPSEANCSGIPNTAEILKLTESGKVAITSLDDINNDDEIEDAMLHEKSTARENDYGSTDSEDEIKLPITCELQQWALKYQVRQNALNELLVILRSNSNTDFTILPKDSRSLMHTPRTSNIVSMGNGEYWYNGLENCLKYVLLQRKLESLTCIYLTFNIDGLPIAKSSKKEFWPILCKIDQIDIAPLVIAIFFGSSKPPLELFLRPFVDELLKILQDGLIIQTKIITVKIRCFICDTPARCFIKGTVGFNSYHGCMKCTTIGEYDRRGRHMSFPRIDMPLRTDESFRNRLNIDHHKDKSAIEDLPVDLVKDFIIADSLHLLDLGVMKRCLLGWVSGSFNFQSKWCAREIQEVSKQLMEIKLTTPSDIQQGRLRELDTIHFWKASEFKNFLLYYGPVVLKDHLTFEIYQHFLSLFCATTICSSDAYITYRHIAEKLFVNYIEKFAEIYGQDSVSSNVHNLCHIVNDVKRFGSLPSLSAYPFESMLCRIKNLLRTGNKPLAQVANRLQELSRFDTTELKCKEVYPSTKCEILSQEGETVFKTVLCETYHLSKNIKDMWFLTTENNIIQMDHATSIQGEIKIFGRSIENKFNFFERPFNSSHLNIYATALNYEMEELKPYELQNIKCKLTSMVCKSELVFIPVLTTMKK